MENSDILGELINGENWLMNGIMVHRIRYLAISCMTVVWKEQAFNNVCVYGIHTLVLWSLYTVQRLCVLSVGGD